MLRKLSCGSTRGKVVLSLERARGTQGPNLEAKMHPKTSMS
jgi:hypothetical protein